MEKINFNLKPFEPLESLSLDIFGIISYDLDYLKICYELTGDIYLINIPKLIYGERKNNLWKNSCFEFFVSETNSSKYFEFNLSPSSDFNIYAFDDYRTNMKEFIDLKNPSINIINKNDKLFLEIQINIKDLFKTKIPLKLGISAIIKDINNECYYFSLVHSKPIPDFHDRNSFIIDLLADMGQSTINNEQ
ncbi:hypothetical protein MEO93_28515 [Dolichospermum sp. ST_sed3]|nr:hypothetical protein [Dolichospermum sp. ST_sed3]